MFVMSSERAFPFLAENPRYAEDALKESFGLIKALSEDDFAQGNVYA